MKKVILILIFIVLTGCNNTQKNLAQPPETFEVDNSTEVFEEYDSQAYQEEIYQATLELCEKNYNEFKEWQCQAWIDDGVLSQRTEVCSTISGCDYKIAYKKARLECFKKFCIK